jgi:hypothetical protein
MRRTLILFVAAASFAVAATAADQNVVTNGVTNAANALSKELQKRREEFKKLTPEQKEAKRQEFKARLEKRLAELRNKQTNGTLSEDELRELSRREQLLKHFQQPPKTNAPAAPKP